MLCKMSGMSLLFISAFLIGLSTASSAVNCPAPRSPENGLSFIFNEGKVVRFRCHPGYILQGHMRAICNADNQWSHEPPQCVKGRSDRVDELSSGSSENLEAQGYSNRFPIINGVWRQNGVHVNVDLPHVTDLKFSGDEVLSVGPKFDYSEDQKSQTNRKELIDQEVGIAELRHNQEQEVRHQRKTEPDDALNEIRDSADEDSKTGFKKEALLDVTNSNVYWKSLGVKHLARGDGESVSYAGKHSTREKGDVYENENSDERLRRHSRRQSDNPPYEYIPSVNADNPIITSSGSLSIDATRLGSSGITVSRAFDYFGRPVQQLYGEKAAQQEALLRKQYEQAEFLRRGTVDEHRGREPSYVPDPSTTTTTTTPAPSFQRLPVAPRGDGEITTDFFGRRIQRLEGHKAAMHRELLRKQYEDFQKRHGYDAGVSVSSYPVVNSVNMAAENRDLELRQRSVSYIRQPLSVPEKGVNVQRESWNQAVRTEEFRRRPVEYVQAPSDFQGDQPANSESSESHHQHHHHRHHREHHHNRRNTTERNTTTSEEKPLQLSEKDLELLSKLTPELQDMYLADLIKARHKEEMSPVQSKEFMKRYKRIWAARKAIKESKEDNAEDVDHLSLVTTETTDDTSSESSTERSAKASYDQSCLQNQDIGLDLLRPPRIRNGYVVKYERKKLTHEPFTHYVLVRYKCVDGFELLYEKTDALYCRKRQWVGERPICVDMTSPWGK